MITDELVRRGWALRFMRVGENTVAYAAVKGTEVHFKVLDGCKSQAIQRARLRAFVAGLEDEFEFLTTRVEMADLSNQRFVETMGFTKTWDDGTYQFYLLTALPFERG